MQGTSVKLQLNGSANCIIASWRRIVLDHLLYLLLVRRPILLIQVEGICLCWRLRVHLIQQHLNSYQDLFDGDGGFPALVLVQNTETNGAGRIDVRVEERRYEFACFVKG